MTTLQDSKPFTREELRAYLNLYFEPGEDKNPQDLQTLDEEDGHARLCATVLILQEVLDKSVKLQSHYAVLLNGWDGGERRGFKTAEEWMDRLQKVYQ